MTERDGFLLAKKGDVEVIICLIGAGGEKALPAFLDRFRSFTGKKLVVSLVPLPEIPPEKLDPGLIIWDRDAVVHEIGRTHIERLVGDRDHGLVDELLATDYPANGLGGRALAVAGSGGWREDHPADHRCPRRQGDRHAHGRWLPPSAGTRALLRFRLFLQDSPRWGAGRHRARAPLRERIDEEGRGMEFEGRSGLLTRAGPSSPGAGGGVR